MHSFAPVRLMAGPQWAFLTMGQGVINMFLLYSWPVHFLQHADLFLGAKFSFYILKLGEINEINFCYIADAYCSIYMLIPEYTDSEVINSMQFLNVFRKKIF